MKTLTLILFCFANLCIAQTDPRVMSNRYEPVSSLAIFKDTFIAAYNSGNRAYIESMVLNEAVPEHFQNKLNPINFLLPPHFNTHKIISNINERKDGIPQRLKLYSDSFSHLPEKVVPVSILEYKMPFIHKGKTLTTTTYGFLVVKQEGKLFIGIFNDKQPKPIIKITK